MESGYRARKTRCGGEERAMDGPGTGPLKKRLAGRSLQPSGQSNPHRCVYVEARLGVDAVESETCLGLR